MNECQTPLILLMRNIGDINVIEYLYSLWYCCSVSDQFFSVVNGV